MISVDGCVWLLMHGMHTYVSTADGACLCSLADCYTVTYTMRSSRIPVSVSETQFDLESLQVENAFASMSGATTVDDQSFPIRNNYVLFWQLKLDFDMICYM